MHTMPQFQADQARALQGEHAAAVGDDRADGAARLADDAHRRCCVLCGRGCVRRRRGDKDGLEGSLVRPSQSSIAYVYLYIAVTQPSQPFAAVNGKIFIHLHGGIGIYNRHAA